MDSSERLRERVEELVKKLRQRAIESREEAGRIRRTVYEPTEAEVNCNVRAEVWDDVADELAELASPDTP